MNEWRKEIEVGRFFNCGGQAIAAVAVINYHRGEMFDWAAYIGIGTAQTEEVCAATVAEEGCKLYKGDALYLFPNLPKDKYRR